MSKLSFYIVYELNSFSLIGDHMHTFYAGDGYVSGQLVFSQVTTYLPLKAFSRVVAERRAQHKVQDLTCLDHLLALAFAQLTATRVFA